MKILNGLFSGIKWFEEVVSVITLSFTVIITIMNVVARYVLHFSMPWASEVSGFAWTWTIMIGISLCYRCNLHYGVDFFVAKLPSKISTFFNILVYGLLFVAFVFLTYLSIIISLRGWIKVSSYFSIPYTYKYISAVISFAFMSIHSLRYLCLAVKCPDEFNRRISQGGNGLDGDKNTEITEGRVI